MSFREQMILSLAVLRGGIRTGESRKWMPLEAKKVARTLLTNSVSLSA
jgi:hypothetical protein